MKVKIEIDLTPLEARKLMGLPDVEPMQKAVMVELQKRMAEAMTMAEPESLMRQWAPIGLQSLEQFGKLLWGAAGGAGPGGKAGHGSGPTNRDPGDEPAGV